MKKYMIATKAFHQLEELSRKERGICIINNKDDKNYIGMLVTGFGFFNIKFPKSFIRELTPEEVNKYNSTYVQLNNN